jgi:hypothetical protein
MDRLYHGGQIPEMLPPDAGNEVYLGRVATTYDPLVGRCEGHPLCVTAPDAIRVVAGHYRGLCRWTSRNAKHSAANHPVVAVGYSVESQTVAYVEGRYPNLLEKRRDLHERNYGVYLEDRSGEPVPALTSKEPFTSLAFDFTGRRLAVGGADQLVRVFEYQEGEWNANDPWHVGYEVSSLSFSQSGALYIGLRGGGLRVSRGNSDPRQVSGCDGAASVISVSCPPDREAVSIALPGGAVRVLERSGSLACEHKFQGFVTQLAYKPRSRGNQLAVTCADGQIYVWRPERSTAKPEPFQHCGALVTCMAFTPDGDYLVAGSTCGAVRRWPSV